jgi:hypothetical protein
MGGNDHELALGLAPLEFFDKPVVSCLIQAAQRISALHAVGILLHGVVEHDDFERHARLGLESVAGKVVIEVVLREPVALWF